MASFDIQTDKGAYRYETDGCSLTGPDGDRVDLARFAYSYRHPQYIETQIPFSPDNPVIGKSSSPTNLKIQLGLGCNYSCSYCSQGGQKAQLSATADATAFLDSLDWLTGEPDKIELWGGEPMLYWKKIEILGPALRARFPKARLSIVTNGSLLDYQRALWLHGLGFTLAVSHDGPGQSLRGKDPFDDPAWTGMIQEVFKLFGERICFNVVITPLNFNLVETVIWFERRMGFPVKINVEDVVTDYGGAAWTTEQLAALKESILENVSSGLALIFPRLRWSVQQFMETLATEKRLTGSHQTCQMDKEDHLAVDLHGNVITCQNAGVKSGHKIGRVDALAGVKLDTSRSWASRPNCGNCPVVHLCYGSCMFLDGKSFESSCRASYHYNRAILEGAIYLLTGARVRSISGFVPRRTINVVAG